MIYKMRYRRHVRRVELPDFEFFELEIDPPINAFAQDPQAEAKRLFDIWHAGVKAHAAANGFSHKDVSRFGLAEPQPAEWTALAKRLR